MAKTNPDPAVDDPFSTQADAADWGVMEGSPVPADRQVTTENWGKPPFNRWSFQHQQALFPTVRLLRGDGAPTSLGRMDKPVASIEYERIDGVRETVREMLDCSYTDSFLVMKGDDVVFEEYHNGMTPSRHHLLNSVSKSFAGMLAGILLERGQLELEKTVSEYVPELKDSSLADATVRHLLDMTAGVDYEEHYDEPETDFWVETATIGWRPEFTGPGKPKTLLEYAQGRKNLAFENGSQFTYKTLLTNVLGMVLARAGERRLEELLSAEIWGRIGAEQDAVIVADPHGFPYIGAGMNACMRDLARFGRLLCCDGFYNGQQIVPKSWIDDTRVVDEQVKRFFAENEYSALIPGGHYRNQVWVGGENDSNMRCLGIHGQIIYADQKTDVTMVKLSTQPLSVDEEMFMNAFAAMAAISEKLA